MRYNRHGLIAGSTGSGKTVTVMKIVEELHEQDIPTLVVDIKGDVRAVLNLPGARLVDPLKGFMPLADLNPIILSKLLNLNDTQTAVLVEMFREEVYTWNSLKDRLEELNTPTSNVIRRNMVFIENTEVFSSRPEFCPTQLFEGTNVFDASELQHEPELYATLMIALIDHLYRSLPEVGDKNELVVIIDEAHLLFDGTSARIIQMLERQVRLIRSKGVGIWFATQSPTDIPDNILAQIGTRYQHALRAYTSKEQAKVRATVSGFNLGDWKATAVADKIKNLKVGECVFSTLDENGAPTPIEVIQIDLPKFSLTPPLKIEQTASIKVSQPISGELVVPNVALRTHARMAESKKKSWLDRWRERNV